MKTKIAIAMSIASLTTLPLLAGPSINVNIGGSQPPPPVIVPAPAPPVATVQIGVPDTYVWDGSEYVGVIGDQYFYLGPGNVWLPMDAPRITRFHHWEKGHSDWRSHATVNEHYRLDAHGHNHPYQNNHNQNDNQNDDHNHHH